MGSPPVGGYTGGMVHVFDHSLEIQSLLHEAADAERERHQVDRAALFDQDGVVLIATGPVGQPDQGARRHATLPG